MELCKGEIQAYCTDILDCSLPLILSTLRSNFERNFFSFEPDYTVEIITYNSDQFDALNKIIDDIMSNFTNYYYTHGDNYVEHPYYLVNLEEGAILEDYHKRYYDNNPIFSVNYEDMSDTTTKVIFSIKDRNKCFEALQEYYSSYYYDSVFDDNANILTFKAQEKQLYELLTENNYNLNNFVINELKYIKAICYNDYIEKLSILRIEVDFNAANELVCKCIIADNGFVEDYRKPNILESETEEANVKSERIKKPRTHFSPSVQDLYDYLKRYAPAKNFEIYKEDLIGEDRRNKLYTGMGILTTMVNRLNKEYREISHTDITLMKYDKFLNCYLITDIWKD